MYLFISNYFDSQIEYQSLPIQTLSSHKELWLAKQQNSFLLLFGDPGHQGRVKFRGFPLLKNLYSLSTVSRLIPR